MYLDLEKIKKHLNINVDYTDDDMYLTDLAEVAERVVETHIDNKLDTIASKNGGLLPAPILHAMLLFIGNMYANRESVAFVGVNEIPLSYAYILDLYKTYYHSTDKDEDMIVIIDNLTSNRIDAALSANQGRVLKQLIDNIDAYTKSQTDNLLSSKANVIDVYTKSEVDNKLDEISASDVDLSNYYNKSEVDGKLGEKANIKDVYTKNEADNLLGNKANIQDVPTNISQLTNDSGYITSIPSEYITDTELSSKGYITSIPAEYITEDELNSKRYVTSIQLNDKLDTSVYNSDKETFATTTQLGSYITTSSANSTFATKEELGNINNILDAINGEIV